MQPPQLFEFVRVSTQVPPQTVKFAAQTHWLFVQFWFAPQRVPQRPQLPGSLVRSTQEVPHCASPWLQPAEHLPTLHTFPWGHLVPQVPQLRVLVWRSSQTPVFALKPPGPPGRPPPPPSGWVRRHAVVPCPQTQPPFTQVAPLGQGVSQAPQKFAFVSVSTQTSVVVPPRPATVHFVSPVAQPSWHWPFTHWLLGSQRFPHAPQLFGLELVSMQTLLQEARPPPHTQAPATQFPPAPQTTSQEPQFDGSAWVFVHPPPQFTSPVAQTSVHAPFEQTFPASEAQVVPHVPQFFGSLCVSVQTPLQSLP